MIDIDKLMQLFPNGKIEYLKAFLATQDSAIAISGLNTNLRIRHFLSQCAEETGGFSDFDEGASANTENYEDRTDLGNSAKGDGYRFRGRGAIQLTGKGNYTWIGNRLGINYSNNPDWVLRPKDSWLTAYSFWDGMRLNRFADKDDLLTLTKRINGGINGLKIRQRWYTKLSNVEFVEG